ncbi:hypothetical protein QO002_003931 [Pararhizobium capsulatum DSM 1112]|uniref:Uncharacterized protein n=1 Tax=Pararhizobium capsulatum DSM 1112 TaxID=1121113 RepID=A0ABU0BU70_9HYPH|nr:hypothetical protein [Pararhizobium capsulatum]MDQ0321793.1 hypothetical protein [Pararhizobium capsulatum DSM 1112]
MSEGDSVTQFANSKPSVEEIELRRYEARLGVWKVVLGTFIVGLAGVLVPGFINFYSALFENWRKEAELRAAQQTAHQQYIKDFLTTAVNQDIELRIRFANYFSKLSEPGQQDMWVVYRDELTKQRDAKRIMINELEARAYALAEDPAPNKIEQELVARTLIWTYAEIGYVPFEQSKIAVVTNTQQRLYRETTALVNRLVTLENPIDKTSQDFIRFWELYRRELIGVESPAFAANMIALGRLINTNVANQRPPDEEMRRLADELESISEAELNADAVKTAGEKP